MTPTPTLYSPSIVSPRSRRLRTVAAVLLATVIAMAIYGISSLMPGVKHAVDNANRQRPAVSIETHPLAAVGRESIHISARSARILRFEVLFAYSYWTVWMLLVLSLLFVAWMDLREVSRNYMSNRRDLWLAATQAAASRSPASAGTPDASASTKEKTTPDEDDLHRDSPES